MDELKFRKRSKAARIISLAAWISLAVYMKAVGCSSDPNTEEAPREPNMGADTEEAVSKHDDLDGGVDSGLHPIGGGDEGDMSTPADLLEDDAEQREHILLLGFDRSSKLPGRTDAMMIVVADHAKKQLGVISIPRDLWVDIPGAEPGRINKVFRVGNLLHGKGGGKRLIKEVIEAELGIEIDYIAAVNFGGFAKIVDILGGIDVEVECPIKDNFISDEAESGYIPLSLDAGRHKMDGETALLFSRSRHGRSDMDRARRQQAVLMGIKRRATSLDVLWRLPSLFDQIKENVATDLDMTAAFRLARIAGSADSKKLHGMVLREPVVQGWKSPEGKSALLLQRSLFDKELASLFDAPPPGEKTSGMCRPTDVALNWKELAKKRKERKKAQSEAENAPPKEEDPATSL